MDENLSISVLSFNVWCTKCNTLALQGTELVKEDAAHYYHYECPTTPRKRFAAHRSPRGDIDFGNE